MVDDFNMSEARIEVAVGVLRMVCIAGGFVGAWKGLELARGLFPSLARTPRFLIVTAFALIMLALQEILWDGIPWLAYLAETSE